jgi:hypothetical protein
MTTTALAPLSDIAAQLGVPLEAVGELLSVPGVQQILMVHGEKDREVAARRKRIDALQAAIDANLRELQSQSLLARAWASVTGHNKRLNKDCEAKAHEIQQTSLLMTRAMVERNDASNSLITMLLMETRARQVSVVREQNDVRQEMTDVARAATANDAALRALRADHETLRADHEALREHHEALRANVQHVHDCAPGRSPKAKIELNERAPGLSPAPNVSNGAKNTRAVRKKPRQP